MAYNEEVKNDLIKTAQIVKEKRLAKARALELDNRVKAEIKRLGATPDRYNAVRAILLAFPDQSRLALAVSKAESGLRCNAVGDGGDSIGLFQINKVHFYRWSRDSLFDCEQNTRAAREIMEDSGWWPWSVFRWRRHLQYL